MKPDIQKLRRFCLAVALLLLTYSLAVVEFAAPLEIQPLGIPIVVQQPILLPIALVFASIYSTLRFYLFAIAATTPPWRGRAMLLSGKTVTPTPSQLLKDSSDLLSYVHQEIVEYFPGYAGHHVPLKVTLSGENYRFEFRPTPRSLLLGRLSDVDYVAPIWANLVALSIWTLQTFTQLL